ncbi:class I SAM-dependent methyltransferase, partial [Culturomica massiliensis]
YFPMRQLYRFYFRHILPLVGGWISGNKGAYVYLPESVSRFPQGNDFLQILSVCGFKRTFQKRLTFGVASLYVGYK